MSFVLQLSADKPIILIDGSYYVFYRYFATMRWFSFQKKEFDSSTIIENKEFISCFIKHLNADLKKICKKWKTDLKNIVFCTDCQRCKIWRNDIYKEYKSNRTQNANFNGKIFSVFCDYVENIGIQKIMSERLEADDVIYLLQNKLKKYNDIVIITNDNDYLQLAAKNIHIINMQFKDITLRGNQNARTDLIHKAIYGDKSDNIQKIAQFITKDKALVLSQLLDNDLNKWLNENNLMEKFMFNMKLISFENIPYEYVDKFYKNLIIDVK